MPIYIFQHPTTKEIVEVVQRMNEPHIFEKDGTLWNRIFVVPAAKTELNPFSESDWLAYTKNTKGSMGDLWDKSAELSSIRAKKKGGKDPIKQKAINSYVKKTKKPHPLA